MEFQKLLNKIDELERKVNRLEKTDNKDRSDIRLELLGVINHFREMEEVENVVYHCENDWGDYIRDKHGFFNSSIKNTVHTIEITEAIDDQKNVFDEEKARKVVEYIESHDNVEYANIAYDPNTDKGRYRNPDGSWQRHTRTDISAIGVKIKR